MSSGIASDLDAEFHVSRAVLISPSLLSGVPAGCSEEFCEIFRAKDKTTGKLHTCKKFQKRDGRKVRKAAKNEIGILKM